MTKLESGMNEKSSKHALAYRCRQIANLPHLFASNLLFHLGEESSLLVGSELMIGASKLCQAKYVITLTLKAIDSSTNLKTNCSNALFSRLL